MATQNFFANIGKNEDELPPELPLIPLQSKFSMTSMMNPVKGLEMKRMISLNHGSGVEPMFDLSLNNFPQDSIHHQTHNHQQPPQLFNQTSTFMLDFPLPQSMQTGTSSYYPYLQNQQSYNIDLFNNYTDNQQPTSGSTPAANSQVSSTPFRQNQNMFGQNTAGFQNQQAPQQYYSHLPASRNGLNCNIQGTGQMIKAPEKQQVSSQPFASQNIHQVSGGFLQKNVDSFQNMFEGTQELLQQSHQHQNQHQQQHLHQLQHQQIVQKNGEGNTGLVFQQFPPTSQSSDIQEKKEEQDAVVDESRRLNSYGMQNSSAEYFTTQPQQMVYHHQRLQQQVPVSQKQRFHQQYINKEEAEYMRQHLSDQGDDSRGESKAGSHEEKRQSNRRRHEEGGEEEDDLDSQGNDSGTRNKTEWPNRQKGQTKYQQCRHRNIFKNFGNIFRKFVSFHNHFTEKTLLTLQGKEEDLKSFQKWLKKDIRLENKKDFIEGWTVWKDEEPLIRQFKLILKELSRDFFQDYILIYLLNSKLQDLEIHLRSIGPCLAAINQPSILYKFRPI